MNIISFFGQVLADMMKKPSLTCRGLLRLAIVDELGQKYHSELTFYDWNKVFSNSLKNRLDKLKARNTEAIITKLQTNLVNNQVILTLNRI